MAHDLQTRMQVPLSQPSISESDIEAVLSVLRTPTLSIGPKVKAFEEAVAVYSGVRNAVAVNSGTSGLHLCLAAAGSRPRATRSSRRRSASSPRPTAPCTREPRRSSPTSTRETLNIDPDQVEDRISPRTRALRPRRRLRPAGADRGLMAHRRPPRRWS